MTIIWAKQDEVWKWVIYADDEVSSWETKFSAKNTYRPKIRKLERAKNNVWVCSSWTCRQIDYVMNWLDRMLAEQEEDYDKYWLKDIITATLQTWIKSLKELDNDDVAMNIFVVDFTLNECYLIEEYWVNLLNPYVECVRGCWEDAFFKLRKEFPTVSFESLIYLSAIASLWCNPPIYYCDWTWNWMCNKNFTIKENSLV